MVDAERGKVLRRANLVKSADAMVWDNHPGAAFGGQRQLRTLTEPDETDRLEGPYVHAWMDLDDDDAVDAGEDVEPQGLPVQPVRHAATAVLVGRLRATAGRPTASRTRSRPSTSRTASTTTWQPAPISFDEFEGADKIKLHTDDGASTGPNGSHLNNANMFTPRDGKSPVMQMYLWRNGVPQRQQRRRRLDPLPRVHARAELAARVRRRRLGRAELRAGRRDGRGLERLLRQGLPGHARSRRWTRPRRTSSSSASTWTRRARRARPASRGSTARSARRPARAPRRPARGGFTYGDFGRIDQRAGGARRRRDLGRDAVGPAHGDRSRPRRPTARHRRHARRRRPSRRSWTRATRSWSPTPPTGGTAAPADLVGVRQARDGLLRELGRRQRHAPARGLLAAARTRSARAGRSPGAVIDSITGAPVAGAQVSIGGNSEGPDALATTTDAGGNYELSVAPGTYASVLVRRDGYDRVVASTTVAVDQTTAARRVAQARLGGVPRRRDRDLDRVAPSTTTTAAGRRRRSTAARARPGRRTTTPPHRRSRSRSRCRSRSTSTRSAWTRPAAAATTRARPRADYTDRGRGDARRAGTTARVTGSFNTSNWHKLNLLAAPTAVKDVRYVRFTPKTPLSSSFLDVTEFAVYGTGRAEDDVHAAGRRRSTRTRRRRSRSRPTSRTRRSQCGSTPQSTAAATPCTSPFTTPALTATGRTTLEVTAVSPTGQRRHDARARDVDAQTRRARTRRSPRTRSPSRATPRAGVHVHRGANARRVPWWRRRDRPCTRDRRHLADGAHTFTATAHQRRRAPTRRRRRGRSRWTGPLPVPIDPGDGPGAATPCPSASRRPTPAR